MENKTNKMFEQKIVHFVKALFANLNGEIRNYNYCVSS